jgi:hypothetical protein
MVNKTENLKKPQVWALISIVLVLIWVFLVVNKSPQYSVLSKTDPLAMINVLFPYFWAILAAFTAVCLIVFLQKESPLWLHILLLAEISLILYYTPFLLGGFSWSPDSLWHGGVADYMPTIFSGQKLALTEYGESYPLSFLITFAAQHLFSVNVFTYSLYIFPPVCIVLISSLAYFFATRIFDKRTAFLALLFALPSLHYIEPHVSPFATGTVLLLASLVLLTYRGAKALALSLTLIIAVILTHPISPIFLGMYLFSVIIVDLFHGKNSMMLRSFGLFTDFFKERDLKNTKIFLAPLMLVFLSAAWWFWTIYGAAPNYVGVDAPVSKILDLSFLTNLINTLEWTTGGQGFIYPSISQLSLAIYGIFLASLIIIGVTSLLKFVKHRKTGVDKVVPTLLTLTLTAFASGVMSYLLFSSSGERFLLGRGLIFFILMSSICMATFFAEAKIKRLRTKTAIAFMFVLLLFCTFPIISYSKEAYNTFTPSADAGLNFLSDKIDLSKKTLSMTNDQQLASYADLTEGLKLIGFPPDMAYQPPDVAVIRVNSFYLMAMRYDLSLTNNSVTTLTDNLTQNLDYNHVYTNSAFEIYVKAK